MTTPSTPSPQQNLQQDSQQAAVRRAPVDGHEVTILIPCRDEATTITDCVREALSWLHACGVDGEVLVVDNASTDTSASLAEKAGARVIHELRPGYGRALRAGLSAARGTYVIMGDGDGSYDFTQLDEFLLKLRSGIHLVMGNRLAGPAIPGAMPWAHRHLGNPLLSALARRASASAIEDFHCGLRGMHQATIQALDVRSPGMEYATDMVIAAVRADLSYCNVTTTLRPDRRTHTRSHLRPVRDGLRHLRVIARAFALTSRHRHRR